MGSRLKFPAGARRRPDPGRSPMDRFLEENAPADPERERVARQLGRKFSKILGKFRAVMDDLERRGDLR